VVKRILLVVMAGVALVAAGYFFMIRAPRNASPPQTASAALPTPQVGIMVVQPAEVPYPVEYAGRVSGFRDIEVRSRVGGLLLEREFEEGARVTQDQVLFRIDPAPYELARSRAEAQLQQAQAAVRQAEENYTRIEQLVRRGVSTAAQLEDARSQRDQARAGVQLGETEVQNAKLNLSYTTITAPGTGVTALESPPVGALVQAQQTLLTTISQIDPAYVIFSFTDEEGRAFRALNEKREKPISEKDLTVELQFAQQGKYPQTGRIDMAAQRVDLQTGTIQARAVFPNPDGLLLPGQFVRVRLIGITLPDAIVVPQQAVSQGPQGPTVYVVGENDVAQARPIRLGPEVATGWVVQDGLKGGERVIVDGVIRVRPGQPVKPVEMDPKATQSTTPQSGPASGGQP